MQSRSADLNTSLIIIFLQYIGLDRVALIYDPDHPGAFHVGVKNSVLYEGVLVLYFIFLFELYSHSFIRVKCGDLKISGLHPS